MSDGKWQFTLAGLAKRILGHRFVKFGTVGFSGVLVNLAVLYLAQEMLFVSIESVGMRLNLSLGLAIFVATINNFLWNRSWTWGDRRGRVAASFLLQLLQYFIACLLAILIQFVFTRLLAHFMHYLLANLISIGLAALLNYALNDLWTFERRALRRNRVTQWISSLKANPNN